LLFWLFVQLCLSFSSYTYNTIVHSFLDSITSNVGRIHDVNDVFSQIRLPSSILPSFISSYRCIASLVLITTYLAWGWWCNRCFEQIRSMKDNQRKGFFFLLDIYVQVFIERSKDYGSLVLCAIKNSTTFSRGSFYTLTCHINIYIFFIIWIYFTLAYLYIIYIYIYLYTKQFFLSLWRLNTRQKSVNERQWYRIACLTGSYVIIICLYAVCPTYFIFIYTDDKVKKQFVLHWAFVYASHINEKILYTQECLIKPCVCVYVCESRIGDKKLFTTILSG
jgi:hypothetical protein